MSTWIWIAIIVAIVLLIVLIILFSREKGKNQKSATVQPKQASDNKIVVITVPQTIKAGSVSAMITIQIQDLKGNPVEVVSSTVVTLLSSSASGIFSANGNEPAIKAVTVSAGTNSANFYYKDPTKGNPDIIASKDGLAPGTQTETIN
jgi:ABC-type Fe3+-hydroxamate transport system substrate-binding protein